MNSPAIAPRASPETRRGALALAVLASLAVHLAITQWPLTLGEDVEMPVPLTATITELPPPPAPAPAKPAAKPKRSAPTSTSVAIAGPAKPLLQSQTAVAEMEQAESLALAAPFDEPVPAPAETTPPKQLPPRVDLAYRAFLGTQGFLIGEAVYRLDHTATEYKISTVAEARGLAALFFHGQGRATSQGAITGKGLQPNSFSIARVGTGNDRRESASFDWETGMVQLNDDKSAPLELPTYDPLIVLWQFYFAPPEQDVMQFNIATTRKVYHYVFVRDGTETITLPFGDVEAQVWRRESGDGQLDARVWMAPSLHFVAVKVRLWNTRATVEFLLDSIRVDEPVAQQ
ncbi:MAG TPA: DUF3108 domain-containing protein [Casimicrobiaceae bacterium]|nr:DUF3108 domain-containing protein [Casimicrobiaceae bacterium]